MFIVTEYAALKTQVNLNKKVQRKIVNILIPTFLAYVLGAQKNHLNETVNETAECSKEQSQ